MQPLINSNSLLHSKWNYKNYIVFTPKFRRQIIYSHIKVYIERRGRKGRDKLHFICSRQIIFPCK